MALSANAQKYYFAEGDVTSAAGLDGKTFGNGFVKTVDKVSKMQIDANSAYFGDATTQTKFTHRLKSGAKSQTADTKLCQVELNVTEAGTLKVYARTGSNSATDRNLVITQNENKLYDKVVKEANAVKVKGLDESDLEKETNVYPIISVQVSAGTVILTFPTGSMNFYGFETSSTSGIESVKGVKAAFKGATYNVAGQQVNASYKGLVIKDGKKIINK
jgi:hypothetical protein